MNTQDNNPSHLESPEYLRTSLAAAMVLGLERGTFYRDVKLHCINLLLTYADGCHANCAYCGLARGRAGDFEQKSFIRVDWPTLPTSQLIDRMVTRSEEVSRVCLSMVTHQRAYADTLDVVGRIHGKVAAPISVLVAPNLLDSRKLKELKDAGTDIIGVGLDAASQPVFDRTRGKSVRGPLSWDQYWETLAEARRVFGPWKVNAHVVVGIGETDRDLVEVFRRLGRMEAHAHLFSFYPEPESRMARRTKPSLRRYRRIQLVKYLIETGQLNDGQIKYDDEGRIQLVDVPASAVEEAISCGKPFLTGGCPNSDGQTACTRPFGSYRPGQAFRDFPFDPNEDDLSEVRREMRWSELAEAGVKVPTTSSE